MDSVMLFLFYLFDPWFINKKLWHGIIKIKWDGYTIRLYQELKTCIKNPGTLKFLDSKARLNANVAPFLLPSILSISYMEIIRNLNRKMYIYTICMHIYHIQVCIYVKACISYIISYIGICKWVYFTYVYTHDILQ